MNPLAGLNFRQQLRFLANDSIVYGSAAAFNKAFALITFPILAWNLSVEQFGIIDFFNTSIILLTVLIVMGQDSAVARYFYEYPEQEQRCQLISQSLAYQTIAGGVFLPLALVAAFSNIRSLQLPEGASDVLFLVALQALPLVAINFSQNILKWTFRRTQFLTVSLGSTIVSTLGLIAMLVAGHTSLYAIFGVYLATRATFAALGLWYVRDWLRLPTGWSFLREALPFALPFGAISALAAAMPILERASIAALLDAQTLGIYAAGAKVAMLLSLPIQAFQVAWGPFSYATFRTPDGPRTFRFVLRAFTCLALCGGILLTVASPLILLILAPGVYAASVVIVIWLALGRVVEGVGWITELGISLAKRPYWKIVTAFAGVIVTGIAILPLALHFGSVGVAIAALLGLTTKNLIEAVIAERLHPIGWEWRRVMTMLAIASLFGIASSYLPFGTGQVATYVFYLYLAGALAVIVILLLVAFTSGERAQMISDLRALTRRIVLRAIASEKRSD